MKVLDLFSGTYACGDSLNPDFPRHSSTRRDDDRVRLHRTRRRRRVRTVKMTTITDVYSHATARRVRRRVRLRDRGDDGREHSPREFR